MTLNLKLVRHQDGKWKALPTDTDDLSEVSVKERKYAPIDPAQLLKALDNLLSPEGGIKSIEDVPKIASLMKKFSKKLVSRCVYCNVLQATESDIISEYLDKGGWETINIWLQYAKSSSSYSFLLEMLKLCTLLPMTLNRLKENNTAKLIKSLTKHENPEVKNLSTELVNKWMTIIKGKKSSEISSAEKKKKKTKENKPEDDKREEEKPVLKPVINTVKSPVTKLKTLKRTSSDKDSKKIEYYEDVKIDPEPLMPVSKKPRADRPKTAKLYQKKFRATGLEEETPLPKNISKKTSTVDKSAVAAAKNAVRLNSSIPERITEKKLKPENLMAIDENLTSNKGIKLIPAKPRPAYVLHESASFMDALTSQPVAPIKRKKKVQSNKPSTSPTSPTITPPKFQFYKDTLEMNEESKKEESPSKSDSIVKDQDLKESLNLNENEPMDINEGEQIAVNEESAGVLSQIEDSKEVNESKSQRPVVNPNQLRSILSHGRRRGKKKTVRWLDDEDLKEIFYFEMDETERVNVLRSNFGDLKSIETKREREVIELAKRQSGERVDEMRRWWVVPILMDVPPSLVEPGCQSKEKEKERIRQQSTLQEIYFTRDMIPDSPHEPDPETFTPKEPKIIPLDEDNSIGLVSDFSNYEPPKPALPEVLASLLNLPNQQSIQNISQPQIAAETNVQKQPLLNANGTVNPQAIPMSIASPYDPGEPVSVPPPHSNSLLGPPPVIQNTYGAAVGPDVQNGPPQGEWRPQDMPQPDQFYGGFNMNPNIIPEQMPGMPMRPPGINMFRPNMPNGPPPRGVGSRTRRVPCRHFTAGGCRFGSSCLFLHPGFRTPL